uniref:Rieske domain-containing protein n=1 Tax=Chrysotila carterae TaxID=13221 RepID=A0A7S4B9J5_CHRCT|mmetsp:Transcript_47235/g.102580  ORF Transcript_47235/g.102580 Transcript_47235/m.102580 type:complete len:269 (+) Transcript_47235:296-1102(+)|eukprot:872982-Pleurochrysis_carterae.AAC.6
MFKDSTSFGAACALGIGGLGAVLWFVPRRQLHLSRLAWLRKSLEQLQLDMSASFRHYSGSEDSPDDDQGFVFVKELPAETLDGSTSFSSFLVNSETTPNWPGEPLVVWYRQGSLWAMQEACPHARISLHTADIEDFRPHACMQSRQSTWANGAVPRESDLQALAGPCIVCPAHMYVFDCGNGACLTNELTQSARVYAVKTKRLEELGAERVQVLISRDPRQQDESQSRVAGAGEYCQTGKALKVSKDGGNKIQLALVKLGLERKFGFE